MFNVIIEVAVKYTNSVYNGIQSVFLPSSFCLPNSQNNFLKTPAEQRDFFRPKLLSNYIKLGLKNSQCTIERQRSSKKKNLIHLSPILKNTPIFSWPVFVFRHFATYRVKRNFSIFFRKQFSKNIFHNFSFLRSFVKKISLPSLEGDLFVTFDHVKLMRFHMNCGECHISVFSGSVRLSETFIWSKYTRMLLVS